MLSTRHLLVYFLGFWVPACAGGHGGGADDDDDDDGAGCCDGGRADAPPGAGPDAAGAGDDATTACDTELAPRNGFPGDFPELTDKGGFGEGQVVIGFGGDTTTDRDCNRARIQRRPVILLHGNGATTLHEQYGMGEVAEMLRAAGYADAEIWAPSYLGQSVSLAETGTPTRNNIDDIRLFIDTVIDYTGVERVDVVGHSLGCGLVNGYLRGLQKDGSFAPGQQRFDRVGTVVCLGGALYGTGSGILYQPEFDINGAWVQESLTLDGVEDATPFGAAAAVEMQGPTTGGQLPGQRDFHAATALDGSSRRITWVALWSIGDLVDANLHNAGGLGGADLNQGFVLSGTMPGVLTAQLAKHMNLLHDQGVVDAMLPYLNR